MGLALLATAGSLLAQFNFADTVWLASLTRRAAGSTPPPAVESYNFSSSTTAGASVQLTCTNGGNNRLQFVVVGTGDSVATLTVAAITNSSGQVFSKAWATNGPSWTHVTAWYLINPPSGSNLVTVLLTNAFPDELGVIIANVTNVHQTTPLGTAATRSGTDNPSVTVTSASGELVIGGACTDSETTLAASGGTAVKLVANIGSDIDVGMAYYTGAASVGANWTHTGSQNQSAGGVSIKPP